MTDLTEQWKKGELKKGEEYWVILTDEWYSRNPVEPARAFYSYDCEFEGYLDDDIEQVLAPLPSYEEWEQLQNWADFTKDYHGLREKLEIAEYENVQLKELLKKCQESIATLLSKRITEVNGIKQKELLAKIEQALGEDKKYIDKSKEED